MCQWMAYLGFNRLKIVISNYRTNQPKFHEFIVANCAFTSKIWSWFPIPQRLSLSRSSGRVTDHIQTLPCFFPHKKYQRKRNTNQGVTMNCQPKQPNNEPGKGEILQIYHTFEVFGPLKKCTIYPIYMLHVWNIWTHVYIYLPQF